jgi:DNA ligase (NAD+)
MARKKDNIADRYNELCDRVLEYNRHYYELNAPLVDDAEYDRLMGELAEIESKHPEQRRGDSPAAKVGGYASAAFSEVPHDPPMLSWAISSPEKNWLILTPGAGRPPVAICFTLLN